MPSLTPDSGHLIAGSSRNPLTPASHKGFAGKVGNLDTSCLVAKRLLIRPRSRTFTLEGNTWRGGPVVYSSDPNVHLLELPTV